MPPEAELEVLACLRAAGELDARSIGSALARTRPLAHSSVVTLLRRLETKGLVTRRAAPVGKAFLYRPAGKAAATFAGVLDRLVARVFGGDRLSVVSTLFRGEGASAREIAALRELVDSLHELPDGTNRR